METKAPGAARASDSSLGPASLLQFLSRRCVQDRESGRNPGCRVWLHFVQKGR